MMTSLDWWLVAELLPAAPENSSCEQEYHKYEVLIKRALRNKKRPTTWQKSSKDSQFYNQMWLKLVIMGLHQFTGGSIGR